MVHHDQLESDVEPCDRGDRGEHDELIQECRCDASTGVREHGDFVGFETENVHTIGAVIAAAQHQRLQGRLGGRDTGWVGGGVAAVPFR
jgi:hypothetical protein